MFARRLRRRLHEFVDQLKSRRRGVARGCGWCGGGHDQRNQRRVGARAEPLQYHVAGTDPRLGAALLQRLVARVLEAGLTEIAKPKQPARGIARAHHHTVTRKRGNRRIDALDQLSQPLGERHGGHGRVGHDQDASIA